MNKHAKRKIAIIAVILAILVLTLTLVIVKVINDSKIDSDDSDFGESKLEINGEEYVLKDITTYLIIGLDKEGKNVGNNSYINNDQADTLILVVMDNKDKSYTAVPINRDTITDVRVLSVSGEVIRRDKMQIALSHTYGDGLYRSCINTARAVSELLKKIPIDYFASITMDGVVRLTNYITNNAGLSITMDQDYPDLGPEYIKDSTHVLNGEQALNFIRARMQMSDDTNAARMNRQILFINAVMDIMKEKKEDEFYNGLVLELSDYTYTKLSEYEMKKGFKLFSEYNFNGFFHIEGQSVVGTNAAGEEHWEFYPTEESINDLLTTLLFKKK